jgi:hypothetical protein
MKKVFKKTSVKNLSPYYQFGIDYWAISLWIYQMVVYKSEKGTDTSRLFFFQRWIYDGSGISAIRIRCGV